MLKAFLLLGNAPPTRILSYAAKWGILQTRRSREKWGILPSGDLGRLPSDRSNREGESEKRWVTKYNRLSEEHNDLAEELRHPQTGYSYGREPLYVWRYWSRRFVAALNVGTRLRQHRCPDIRDWQVLLWLFRPTVPLAPPKTNDGRELSAAKKLITLHDAWKNGDFERAEALKEELNCAGDNLHNYRDLTDAWTMWRCSLPRYFEQESASWFASITVEGWLRIAGVPAGLEPIERRFEIKTPTLFAGLVLQLNNAFAQSTGVFICANPDCGNPFPPKSDRDRYCEECRPGKKVANCLSNRAYRKRQKAARLGSTGPGKTAGP